MPSLLENLPSTDPNLTITRESLTFSPKPDNFSDITHAITRHNIWLTFYTISARGEESLGYTFHSYSVRADIRDRLNIAGEFAVINELKQFGFISTEVWAEKARKTTEYYYDYINEYASDYFKLTHQDFMVSLKKIVDNQAKQADFDLVNSIIPTLSDPDSPNVQSPGLVRDLEFFSTPVKAAETSYQDIEHKQRLIAEKIQWQSLFKDIGKTEKGQALENQREKIGVAPLGLLGAASLPDECQEMLIEYINPEFKNVRKKPPIERIQTSKSFENPTASEIGRT